MGAVETASPTRAPSVAATVAPDGGTYLAIGDSLTFGIGVRRPQVEGFPARVAARLADANPAIDQLRVFAVPGETASGFVERRLDDVTRAIEQDADRVELVTVGLGANEVLRTRREASCLEDRASAACREIADRAIARAGEALDTILGTVRAALEDAGADARILALAYYNPEVDDIAAETIVGSDGRAACDPAEARPGLNDQIVCAAAAHDAEVVDLYTAFLGREVDLTHIDRDDVHPNAAGYAVIADAIADTYLAGE